MNEKEIYYKLNQHLKIIQQKCPVESIIAICVILTWNQLKCKGGYMRHFLITYKENKRNGLGMIMHRKISISKPTDDIGLDAKAAVGIFISSTGNLKKNEINENTGCSRSGIVS